MKGGEAMRKEGDIALMLLCFFAAMGIKYVAMIIISATV